VLIDAPANEFALGHFYDASQVVRHWQLRTLCALYAIELNSKRLKSDSLLKVLSAEDLARVFQ